MSGHVAHAEVTVDATPQQAWSALTDPERISEWMVGTKVDTTWEVGSPAVGTLRVALDKETGIVAAVEVSAAERPPSVEAW